LPLADFSVQGDNNGRVFYYCYQNITIFCYR
jgi:hypothetical protein